MNDDFSYLTASPETAVTPRKSWSRFSTLWVLLCLLVVGTAIFRAFLFGGAVLLYKDSGGDSLNFYYPWFVELSRYLRDEGIPSWSFHVAMGQDIFHSAGYLILEPVTWLPKDLIAPALIYQHLARVVLAGLLFFWFLRLRLSNQVALLGAILIAFSAYMCMGASWPLLAQDMVCFTALLFAVERALQKGRWFLVPLAVALVGLISSFHLYLCALFLSLYVPARLFGQHGWRPGVILRGSMLFAGAACLGAGLGAVIAYPNLQASLNSPPGSNVTSLVSRLSSFSIFGFATPVQYITAAIRPFSNDLLGTAEGFRGWANYLEAPLSYCGLICLVLIPQSFRGTSRRQKILFTIFLGGILLSTVFPWFRYLFWLFQGDYYRTLSLFSILGLTTMSMLALRRYVEGKFSLWILGVTCIVLVGTLYLPIKELQIRLDPFLKPSVAAILAGYTLLLALGHLLKRTRLFAWIIAGVVVGELVLFDTNTVSGHRAIVKREELTAPIGYNDRTIEALNEIKAADPSSFFRVTKTLSSSLAVQPGLNDAMVFGFYGTSSYRSFNNPNYMSFLTAVNAIRPNSETDPGWIEGLQNDPLLSLFGGEKYVLADDPLPFQRAVQYELVKDYGQFFLFRNARFLPLGLAFDHFITESAFVGLPPGEKPGVLLQTVVLSENDGDKYGLRPAHLTDLEQAARNLNLADVAGERRQTALQLTSFRQTHFGGRIVLPQKSVVVIQTPFDRGWEAFQDGKPAPVLRVDAGLLGVGLESGEHDVELKYRNPHLAVGALISLASGLLLVVALWRWPRLHLPAD